MPIDLRISLLGTFRMDVNGRTLPVEAWHRSKAKALVKLVALSAQHRRHREQLMEILWPETDSQAAGASLRKAIHHARQFLGGDVLQLHDDLVALHADNLRVDVDEFDAAARAGDLQTAIDLYSGDLLPEDSYEPWAVQRRDQLRGDFARLLLDRAAELERQSKPRDAAAALERLIGLDPLNEEAYCQLIRLHGLAGNRPAALRWYGQLDERLRQELGVEPGPKARQFRDDVAAGRTPGVSFGGTLLTMPPVHYASSGDVNIAYQVVGEGPIDLVYVMGWVTHLGFMWHQPICVRFFERLAGFSRVLIFDKRGTGMSDRVPIDRLPSLEQRMDDVRAVMDAAGSRRAAIFGVSEGGPMAAMFAATYPERTHALLLYGSYAKRISDPDYPWAPTRKQREDFYELIRTSWGGPVDSADLAPSMAGDGEFAKWWARYCQMAVSPAAALALARMNSEVDVRHVLPTIRVPTLILHRRDDYESIGGAYYMAEHIPAAKMKVLPGADHYVYAGNQEEILEPIRTFLAELDEPAVSDTILATVLSVECAGGVDAERNRLEMAALQEVHRHRGRQLAGGSRILAAFDGPARAVRCAQVIVNTARAMRIVARAGIHTGECEVLGEQLRGATLAIAREISALAKPYEVVASQTVKDLVAGSGLDFQERGVLATPGLPNRWQLFSAQFTTGERATNARRTAPL